MSQEKTEKQMEDGQQQQQQQQPKGTVWQQVRIFFLSPFLVLRLFLFCVRAGESENCILTQFVLSRSLPFS
jgi:hypothetical protein